MGDFYSLICLGSSEPFGSDCWIILQSSDV